jgi:hypothetical protein
VSEGRRTTGEAPEEGATVERRETILFYLLGVVGLVVVSILSTSQIKQ